jgi:hypothetical protein
MNTPRLAVKPRLPNQIALAVIAALALWCGQAKAQIAVLDSDYLTMTYQGGITNAAFSQPATVSPGASALVVLLANSGATNTGAEPPELTWQGQTLERVVSINNVIPVYGDVTIYCLFRPIPGGNTNNITGTYEAVPTDDWVSVFTLSGASRLTAPMTGTANSTNSTTLTFDVTNILDGAFAAVCGLWSSFGGADFGLQASGGTMTPQYDSTDDSATVAMGTVSGLSAGTASFTYNVLGGAAQMAFDGVVFSPISLASLSATNSTITASPAALPANGLSTATITVQAVNTNGGEMEVSAGPVTLQTTAGALSRVTDNHDGSYTALLTSPIITSTTNETATITGTIHGGVIGHPASVELLAQSFSPGFLKLEVYLNAPGSNVADLLTFTNYPAFPTEVHYVPLFEIPPDKYNSGNAVGTFDLGERLSGFIVPAETTNYVFYMSANMAGELWLSTNADPAGLRMIAQGNNDYPALTYDTNCSAPIQLVAGQRYYVEALEKATTNNEESMAVAWTTQNEPPPPFLTAPIAGQFLATFVDMQTTPPTAVTNLLVEPSTNMIGVSWLWVEWTAPSDPGATNPVAGYDLRYSTQTITSNNWASATPADTLFCFGQPAGTAQQLKVTGLNPSTTYYFAIRSIDPAGNVSELSNVATGTTMAVPPGGFNTMWELEFNVPGVDPTAAGDWRNRQGSLPAGTTWADLETNGCLTCPAWNPILDTVPKNDFNYPFIVQERCRCLSQVDMSGAQCNGADFFINMDYRSDGKFAKFSFALGLTNDTQELDFVNWATNVNDAVLLTNYTGLSADFHVIRVEVDTTNTTFTTFIDSTNMGTVTYFRIPTTGDGDCYATILGWGATAQWDYIRIGTPIAPLPPQLNISRIGNSVAVSWPTNATGFTLQTTASLAPASWSNAGNPVVQGAQNVFTIVATNAARFYRLEQ